MADDSLHVDITADADGAASAFSSLETRLAELEAAFKKSGGSVESLAGGTNKAKIAAEEAGGAFSKLAGFFEDVEKHSRTAGIALNSVGLKSEAAAAKVAGLGQLFDGFGKAVPSLLAVGTAVAAIGGAFEFFKDASEKAAEWQHQMALLGATVRDQGGDWGALSQKVEQWADLQERTTEFSRDDATKALTTLTATGMKLGDAMKVTRVAEDAAAATGRSLTEINFALSEAMHGRTQALTQLGLGTKASIKDGMKFSTVLGLIEQHMGGTAAAGAETYSGKLNQLHNSFTTLEEKIGSAVLPALTGVTKALIGMIESAEAGFKRWETAVNAFYQRNKEALDALAAAFKAVWSVISTNVRLALDVVLGVIKAAWNQIVGDFDLIADLLTGHWSRLWGDLKQLTLGGAEAFLSTFGNFGDNLITISERVTQSIGKMFAAMWKDIKSGHFGDIGKDVAAAFAGDLSGLKSWTLAGGGGASEPGVKNSADIAGISSGLADTVVGGKSGAGSGNKAHAQMLKDINAEVQALDDRRKMGQITYGEEEQDIQKILASHKLSNDDRQKWENKLTSLYQEEAKAALAVYDAEQKIAEAAQKRAGILANSQMQTIIQTGSIMSKIDDKNLKIGLADSDKLLRNTISGITRETVQAGEAIKKLTAEQKKNYEQEQRYLSGLSDQGMKVFDEIFSRGKKGVHGWGETFKSTLKDIEHALEKSLLMQLFAGMLGGKTNFGANFAGALGKGGSPLAGIFGSLLGGGSGHGASGAGAAGNASSSGVFGVVLGPSASAQAASSLPTDSLTSFMFGVGAPQVNGGGAGGGSASGVLGAIGGAGGAGGVASILGADVTGGTSGVERSIIAQVGSKGLGNVFKGGIPGISKALGFGQGSIWEGTSGKLSLGGAAVGVGAGQLFGNLWSKGAGGGSHSTWGSIAGGIGGLVGGPVGGLIGAGIGSLFGHADNPKDMPDKYDTQNYGTIIANLIGHAGANGQNFSMDSTIASIVGTNPVTGQSQSIQGASGDHWNSGGSIAYIEETLAKYGSADKAPSWLQPMFNQMVSMFGMSSSGSGHLNFGQHINNEHITGAQGVNGQTYQYTDLGQAAEQFFEAYMQQGQVGTSTSVNTNPGNGQGTSNNPFQVVNPFSNLPVFNVGNGMPASVVPYTSPAAGGPNELMHGAPVAPTTPPISPPNWNQMARTITGGNPWGFKSAPSVTVNVQGSLITQGQVASAVGSAISGAKWQSPFSSNAVQYGLDNA